MNEDFEFLKKRVSRLEVQVAGLVGQLAYTNSLIQAMADQTAKIAERAASAIEVLERMKGAGG